MFDQIVILGAGKIARGLANALPVESSLVLSSRTCPDQLGFPWIPLDKCFDEVAPALVILATAWPVDDAYQKACEGLTPDVPVLSVVKSASLEELQTMFGDRPLARFLCSVAASDQEALRFYDTNSSPIALQALMEVLPATSWKAIPGDRFERYGQLLACSAAHCATLHLLSQWLDCNKQEQEFLGETLLEAYRLLVREKTEPLGVLDQSMTPGGNTEALCRNLFRQGDELSEMILARRSDDNQGANERCLEQNQ